ncbi:MAG: Smr/MutS family protein [Myxococcota bacterium]
MNSHDDPEPPPVVIEIGPSIDLHHFHPSEILDVVDAYLDAAQEAGFTEVRLIHGKGRGVQRGRVQEFLRRDPRVIDSSEAPPLRGGWGATLAVLVRPD